ncbi:hypothetical protein E2320_006655 [Naja naja]|nr:hypothetical protein E2320_006655 [Naja naja]
MASSSSSSAMDGGDPEQSRGAGGGSGPVLSELQREKRLACVEFPGVVQDVGKTLLTLGGEEGVSRIYADPSKRLELYFRPKDPYCHPVCANRFPTSSMLLKVKKKTRRKWTEEGSLEEEIKFEVEILGVISTVYKFQGMSDFQYLVMHSEPDGKQTSMYDKVLMLKPEKEDFFMNELPLYIPPPIFSRLDNPIDYYYRPDVHHSRARRPHNAIFVNFEDGEVPSRPLEAAVQTWKKVCSNTVDHQAEAELKKLFELRPVWSRNAVKANISVHPDKLKLLLPYLAYYMLTGPWRSLWVRFGYDPRKHPEAKIYQVLDFRIRCGMKYGKRNLTRQPEGYNPNDMPVKAKRSTYNYSLPITLKKPGNHGLGIQDLKQGLSTSGTSGAKSPVMSKYKLKDSIYTFEEGSLPPYRQMFYQLCDLKVESLQKIIHRNDNMEAASLFRNPSNTTEGKEQLTFESGEEEEEEEEEEVFKPSDGSENEMETEILDYV